MLKYLLFFVLFSCTTLVWADSETNRIHPDEPIDFTENHRFSNENSLQSLQELEGSLESFRKMTQAARDEKIIILSQYQYTDWEIQNLGFPNMVMVVAGGIHRQNYLLHKLQYQLALEKKKNGTGSTTEVSLALQAYQKYKKQYDKFRSKAIIAD